jgi:uncharacterized protein
MRRRLHAGGRPPKGVLSQAIHNVRGLCDANAVCKRSLRVVLTERHIVNQTYLITGASYGIGEALAIALAARGSHVLAVARSEDKLAALAKRIEAASGTASYIACDLALPGAATTLFEQVKARGIAVDGLINNAGLGTFGPFEAQDAARMRDMMQVNMLALTELSYLFVPSLLERKGKILNLASTAGFAPAPNMAVYAATKAYVVSLTEALWAEYRARGLHVACVCPGPVETPFLDAMGGAPRTTAVYQNITSVDDVVATCMKALEGSTPTYRVGLRAWLLSNVNRFVPRTSVVRIASSLLAPKP